MEQQPIPEIFTFKGKSVVFEGHDGTGKSLQVEMMRKHLLEEHGIESIEFHEPAGSPIADKLRDVIKNYDIHRDAMTNVLMFSAARHELWNERAIPALKMGMWVVTSRSWLSSIAFQGYGEGLGLEKIKAITELATDEYYMNPDYEFVLDVSEAERIRRIANRGELEVKDTFESKPQDFQDRVRNGYLQIAADRNIPIISADGTPEQVHAEILKYIKF